MRRFFPLQNLWLGPFLWQVGLLRLILRRRPDVVIFLGSFVYLSTWLGTAVARLRNARVLFWTIGWHRPEGGIRKQVRLLFYRLADQLLIYGNVGRQIGVELGFPPERMTVVYNSSSDPIEAQQSDPGALAAFAAQLPTEEMPTVGAVIRLNPVKRLDLLIRAAAVLRARGRDLTVLLVGDGPEREHLRGLADDLKVPLILPGPAYDDEQLALFYRRTLITVVPSAAGLTVLQSLKFGRPVITHDQMYEQMPECEAIIAHQTGDLYRYGELEDLADTIERWLIRQAAGSRDIAERCREVVRTTWSAENQAAIISAEVQRGTLDRQQAQRVRR